MKHFLALLLFNIRSGFFLNLLKKISISNKSLLLNFRGVFMNNIRMLEKYSKYRVRNTTRVY